MQWQRTKDVMEKQRTTLENNAIKGMEKIERQIVDIDRDENLGEGQKRARMANILNDYTYKQYDAAADAWQKLEERYWTMFGMGF